MGDPRQLRKKYSRPRHLWQQKRIEAERKIKYDYGLKTKQELWRFESILKRFTNQAKRLIALRTEQAGKEKQQLLDRLARLGLLKSGAALSDVLGLTVEDVLERRLQTQVHKKNLARSAKQARQFIVHGHIHINNKIISAPSYMVTAAEEPQIRFIEKSTLSNEEHPERTPIKKPEKKETDKKKEAKPKKKAKKKVKRARKEEKK